MKGEVAAEGTAVIRDARLASGGKRLAVRFRDGSRGEFPIAGLPFAPADVAVGVEVIAEGDAVEVRTTNGDFDVMADELWRLAHKKALGNNDLARAVGANIRRLREARGLLLKDLEAMTGIAVPNLSNLQAGRSVPRLETLHRIADALGVSVAALVGPAAAVEEPDDLQASSRVLYLNLPIALARNVAERAASDGRAIEEWVLLLLWEAVDRQPLVMATGHAVIVDLGSGIPRRTPTVGQPAVARSFGRLMQSPEEEAHA